MNKEYRIISDKIVVRDEKDQLRLTEKHSEFEKKLILENLIENIENVLNNMKLEKENKTIEKVTKNNYRGFYEIIILLLFLINIYTAIPMIFMNELSISIIIALLLGPNLALSLGVIGIIEIVVLPKKLKKIKVDIDKKYEDNSKKLQDLLNRYRKELESLKREEIKIETQNNSEEEFEYKYTFNEELLNNPFDYQDVNILKENEGFTRKRTLKI